MQPKMDFAKISDSTMPPRCYTGFPGHPECDGYMSQELQGNHTKTGTRPHNGLTRAVALAPCWRVVCVWRAWPPLDQSRCRVGQGGWVDGSVWVDTTLEGFQIAVLFHIGQSFCVSLDAGPLSLFVVCCLMSVPHPSTVLPTTAAVQDARLAASCRWDCSRTALGCGSPVDRQACRTLLSAAGEALWVCLSLSAPTVVSRGQ